VANYMQDFRLFEPNQMFEVLLGPYLAFDCDFGFIGILSIMVITLSEL
jgi:hypothetical protein